MYVMSKFITLCDYTTRGRLHDHTFLAVPTLMLFLFDFSWLRPGKPLHALLQIIVAVNGKAASQQLCNMHGKQIFKVVVVVE